MFQSIAVHIPHPWKPLSGAIPNLIKDDVSSEDLYAEEWENWSIWIGGGEHFSRYQCSLVDPDHRYLMRDFLDTSEQVQAWVDRVVVVAQKAYENVR